MNERDLSIVLAALRMAQDDLAVLNAMPHLLDTADIVTAQEIDELCEELNVKDDSECSE